MAPVVKALEQDDRFDSKVLVTAQHREMLDQVLNFFDIKADFDLDIMEHGQSLEQITSRVILGCSEIFEAEKPDVVLVHGDTTTTFAAALAAFYKNIKVGHIEAGMRTGDIYEPFPEELNRSLVGRIAHWHFAPSQECEDNLIREGISPDAIVRNEFNTGVSALLLAKDLLGLGDGFDNAQSNKILVTAHRRESWGEGMRAIFSAIAALAYAHPELEFDVATHANPIVAKDAEEILAGIENVSLIGPQGYGDFVGLMAGARLILSDSGGIQEEGPTLGVPVIVLRNKTEYQELASAGVVKLAGTSKDSIVSVVEEALADRNLHARVAEFAAQRSSNADMKTIALAIAGE